MTNEEIAKDLTVALINKMISPTADITFDTYHAILQRIGETRGTVTLQTIEDHLKKQDKYADISSFGQPMALGAAIILAAITMIWPNPATGWPLFILGIVYLCWVVFRLFWNLRRINP